MAKQRERARAASKFVIDMSTFPETNLSTAFSGYDLLEQKTKIIALYQDGRTVNELASGDAGGVILEATPFYAESGGQVGDQGKLSANDMVFDVIDTQKQGKTHVHIGEVTQGILKVGEIIIAQVDQHRRSNTIRNHSATHLLHAALRKILGDHVVQKGSLVAPDRLRFDFSHSEPVSSEELQKIEWLVNSKILENLETVVETMPLQEAMDSGAMSLFGEKYEETVRVLKIGGEFSTELCGGTHVAGTGDIGFMKIVSETGIAAGIRPEIISKVN
jgi:alanyl-tRNA synthetase